MPIVIYLLHNTLGRKPYCQIQIISEVFMLIKSCFNCEFHNSRKAEEDLKSHCRKENCWSEFSKCVAQKALKRFLEQESSEHKLVRQQVVSA